MRFTTTLALFAAAPLVAPCVLAAQTVSDRRVAPVEPLTIYFDWDRFNLTPDAVATLDTLIAELARRPWQRLVIEGHTDTLHTREYALGLSQRQANSVKDYLVRRGITAKKIVTIGYGSTKLAIPTRQRIREGRNRRAVIRVE